MAQIVYLKIQVDDAQLDELKAGLDQVGGKVEIIEQGAGKVDKGIGKIGKSSIVFQQLNKWTGGLAGNLVDVYNGLKGVNLGLQATKAALVATGIGALVVGLGLVVAYWEDISEYITQANHNLQEKIDKNKEILSDLDYELKILELREKILKAEGESTEAIRLKKEEILKLQIAQNGLLLTNLKTQQSIEMSKLGEFKWWEKILIASGAALSQNFTGAISREEEVARLAEIKKQIEEITVSGLQAELALAELLNPKSKKKKQDQTPRLDKVDTEEVFDGTRMLDRRKELEDLLLGGDENLKKQLLDSAKAANQEFIDSELAFQARRTQIEMDNAEARKRIAQIEFEYKQKSMFAYGDAAMEVGALIGEQTALGKGLSVAGALINTYASIAGQLKAFAGVPIPGFAIAQAIATGAAGLAAVKNILSVKVPGKGGGSSGGGIPSSPPAFNVVESSPQNQLNNSLLAQNDQPVKAFVVEGEVTSAEQLRRSKISTSSL